MQRVQRLALLRFVFLPSLRTLSQGAACASSAGLLQRYVQLMLCLLMSVNEDVPIFGGLIDDVPKFTDGALVYHNQSNAHVCVIDRSGCHEGEDESTTAIIFR